jgi:hypothetical protein
VPLAVGIPFNIVFVTCANHAPYLAFVLLYHLAVDC